MSTNWGLPRASAKRAGTKLLTDGPPRVTTDADRWAARYNPCARARAQTQPA